MWDGEAGFVEAALEWYDDVDGLDRWMVADGPEEWRRIDRVTTRSRARLASGGEVSNIVLDDHRISFTTTAIGVPHMVKVSYFPNWEADGADGPYHAAPSLMIVVPTEENVVLEFRDQPADTVGKLLTAGTLIWLVVFFVRRRRSSRDSAAGASLPA